MTRAWLPAPSYMAAVIALSCLNLLALKHIDTGLFVLVNFPARIMAAIGLSSVLLASLAVSSGMIIFYLAHKLLRRQPLAIRRQIIFHR